MEAGADANVVDADAEANQGPDATTFRVEDFYVFFPRVGPRGLDPTAGLIDVIHSEFKRGVGRKGFSL